MIRFALVITSCLFFAACSQRGIAPAAATEEIFALDQAWIDAEVRGDRAALERILDERFRATFASGRTIDRVEFIDQVLGADIQPFEVVHDVVEIHGDTALIIDLSQDGTTKYTWIAVKRMGEWRAISETFTRVAPPAE